MSVGHAAAHECCLAPLPLGAGSAPHTVLGGRVGRGGGGPSSFHFARSRTSLPPRPSPSVSPYCRATHVTLGQERESVPAVSNCTSPQDPVCHRRGARARGLPFGDGLPGRVKGVLRGGGGGFVPGENGNGFAQRDARACGPNLFWPVGQPFGHQWAISGGTPRLDPLFQTHRFPHFLGTPNAPKIGRAMHRLFHL